VCREEFIVKRLVISALSAPSELNGVSRHAANIVLGLLSRPDAPEIHFIAGAWQEKMYSRAIGRTDSRLHMHWLSIRRRNLDRVFWYYHHLPRVAARLGADVVHLAYTMPLRADAFQCPTVVSLHDLYPFDIPKNFGIVKGVVNRQLMHQCLRTVGAIACVSASTRNRLAHWCGPTLSQKAVTIPNAVEPATTVSAEGPGGLRAGEPFLLCIAQHRQNKNIPLALRIFERVLRHGVVSPSTRLLIVGIPGPDTSKIHAQISKSGLENHAMCLRGMSDPELQWCYRNCGLLLAPSSIEGFGLPIAEALLAGCPVVCSDIAAFREIGAERCRYVGFGDGMLWNYETAIRETLAEPHREPIALPRLLPNTIAGMYMTLYRKLLGYAGALPLFGVGSSVSESSQANQLQADEPKEGKVSKVASPQASRILQ
jgi:glycosyltransferase involved in cell wall biosynthesis